MFGQGLRFQMDCVMLFLCLLDSGVDCITCQAHYRHGCAERPAVQLLRDLHRACPHSVCQQNSCKWQAVSSFSVTSWQKVKN